MAEEVEKKEELLGPEHCDAKVCFSVLQVC